VELWKGRGIYLACEEGWTGFLRKMWKGKVEENGSAQVKKRVRTPMLFSTREHVPAAAPVG
jgi:hypothetical protein